MKGLTKIFEVIILLCSFTTASGQKVYNIVGMKEEYTAPGSEEAKIYPLKFKVFITDSTFSSDGLRYKYTITKKVDSSYFKND
jgi:hypothetical protein